MPVRITHIHPPTNFIPALITLHFRSTDDDRLILQHFVEAADVVDFKVELARRWRTGLVQARTGGEADAELIPVQDGEVLGRVRRPTRHLAEAERLRVELDRAP